MLVLAEMVEADPPLTTAFVGGAREPLAGAGLRRWRSRCRGSSSASPSRGRRSSTCSSWRAQSQAADQVSIGNSIGSLRFLGAIDWRDFVEAMSVVEQTLRDDPAGSTRRWTSRRAIAIATSSNRSRGAAPCPEHDVARTRDPTRNVTANGRAAARRLLPHRHRPTRRSNAPCTMRRSYAQVVRGHRPRGATSTSTAARSRP